MDHPESPSRDGGALGGPIVEEGTSGADNVWERAADQARRDTARTQERPSAEDDEKPAV
jgi:hypothetical protein